MAEEGERDPLAARGSCLHGRVSGSTINQVQLFTSIYFFFNSERALLFIIILSPTVTPEPEGYASQHRYFNNYNAINSLAMKLISNLHLMWHRQLLST
jgi:hypothetical protein